jgi:tetratricopeptide (TPR) repeat protein
MLAMDLKWRAIAAGASLLLALIITFIPSLGLGFSFIFWLIFLVFVAGYFLLGTLSAASKRMQFEDFDGAERILGYTKFPNLLLKMNQAYFHLLKGMIAMKRNQLNEAEELMQKAYDIGLPTNNDKAMVLFNLAQINYNKKKFNVASAQLRQIKEMGVNEPNLLHQMAQLENALKVRPSGMQQMMYRGMGGRGVQQRMIQQQPGEVKKSNNRKPSSKRKKK